MCTHPPEARRTRTVTVRGYVVTTRYCPQCWIEQQRARRAKVAGRMLGINAELQRFAKLPVLQ